jgi:hypothetical protein
MLLSQNLLILGYKSNKFAVNLVFLQGKMRNIIQFTQHKQNVEEGLHHSPSSIISLSVNRLDHFKHSPNIHHHSPTFTNIHQTFTVIHQTFTNIHQHSPQEKSQKRREEISNKQFSVSKSG